MILALYIVGYFVIAFITAILVAKYTDEIPMTGLIWPIILFAAIFGVIFIVIPNKIAGKKGE
jgi:hypothetical protein